MIERKYVSTCAWTVAIAALVNVGLFLPTKAEAQLALNPDFEVEINNKALPVYSAKIGIQYQYACCSTPPRSSPVGFTNFDINGSVNAVVTVKNRTVTSAKMLPSPHHITPTVNGNVISFQIPKPGKYEVLINGDFNRPLYLFANPPEVNVPQPGTPGVIYYRPGVHNIGYKNIGSNTTVYLAPGAVVYGGFKLSGATNVKFRGRGILSGSKFAIHERQLMVIEGGGGHSFEGITLIDSPGWTMSVYHTRDVLIDNVKQISYRQNSDGIDVVSSRNVEIKNVFIRNWDDGIVIKATGGRDLDNVYAHDSVLTVDYGSAALEVGMEANANSVGNVRFENIDILHSHANHALHIGSGDRANIHDITYNNIRIEDYIGNPGWSQKWITLAIRPDAWTSPGGPGQINNVTFKNVSFLSGRMFPSKISGYDTNHMVKNVKFNNLQALGAKVTSASQINMSIANAANITFN